MCDVDHNLWATSDRCRGSVSTVKEVRKVRAERESFEAFVAEVSSDLLRSAFVLTGDRHLCEDLVQETFIRVARHWNRVADDDRSALPYARKVLYRLWLDRRRWQRRHPEYPLDPLRSPGIQDQSESVVAADALASALADLSPTQRAVLVLRYVEDRTEGETAQILGCTVAAVHGHVHRGLNAVRTKHPELYYADNKERRS